jgi:hypothetical protein
MAKDLQFKVRMLRKLELILRGLKLVKQTPIDDYDRYYLTQMIDSLEAILTDKSKKFLGQQRAAEIQPTTLDADIH